MKTTTLVISLSAGFACLTFAAQESPRWQWLAKERFRQFDKNGDGRITREESANARWFDTLDLNHDGLTTLEETKPAAAIGAARAKRGGTAGGGSDQLRPMPPIAKTALARCRCRIARRSPIWASRATGIPAPKTATAS